MKVTVYTTPSCPQCEMTKKTFTRGNVQYNVVDLSADPVAMEMVKALGYSAAPVVIAGDSHWSGFRLDMIKSITQRIHSEEAHKPKEEAAA